MLEREHQVFGQRRTVRLMPNQQPSQVDGEYVLMTYNNFLCNTTEGDMKKIARLKMNLKFGPAGATPGFTAKENQEAGLIGVWSDDDEGD